MSGIVMRVEEIGRCSSADAANDVPRIGDRHKLHCHLRCSSINASPAYDFASQLFYVDYEAIFREWTPTETARFEAMQNSEANHV
jgi:hypothetical protein